MYFSQSLSQADFERIGLTQDQIAEALQRQEEIRAEQEAARNDAGIGEIANDHAREAANRAFQLSGTNILRYPRFTDCKFIERNAAQEATGTKNIFSTVMEAAPFPDWMAMHIQADIDSVYAQSDCLATLLKTFGDFSMLKMQPNIDPSRKAYGSRFYVDCTLLEEVIFVANAKAERVPLHWFQNIEIAELQPKGFHRPLKVFFHCLKTRYIKKDMRFTKVDIAVITAALNMARQQCIENTPELGVQLGFHDFHAFESNYGEINKKTGSKIPNELTQPQAIKFATAFEECLKAISENDVSMGAFYQEQLYRVRSENEFKTSRSEMVLAAKDLVVGGLFSASLAGVKKFFHTQKFQSVLIKPAEITEQYQTQFDEKKDEITEVVNRYIEEVNPDFEDYDDLFFGESYGNGPLTIDRLKHVPFERIKDFFPTFLDDIEWEFNYSCNLLFDKLHSHLMESFGEQERVCEIHFDAGVEIRMPGQVSLLLDLDKAVSTIKKCTGDLW